MDREIASERKREIDGGRGRGKVIYDSMVEREEERE